ncbi:MAG: type I DNA topoisomerase [Candidatus Omnitrophota bacterium]|nr:type I DNA topoisomerase [Candidatus Omnitrophota bacterium]
MDKFLVIVESPTKAKTIHAILGEGYEVTSSMGHVVDLASNKLSVDIKKGFLPHYRVIPGKEKVIAALKKSAQDKEIIYIATDPDREGEAIGWHIKEQLAKVGNKFCRVVFHEITEDALREAFANPGELDIHKINSQLARRVLDRIVGYLLSPLLWKKIVRGLSAGRVQSVALKFIVEREKEIKSFIPKTTFYIEAAFKCPAGTFKTRLAKYKNKEAIFENKEGALKCIEAIKHEHFAVKEVIRKEIKRKPPSPLTTSLLQQDAFNKLRFSSQKTMLVAQRLYEGTQIKEKSVGLITYMRTDSFHIAEHAKGEIKEFVRSQFGKNYLPQIEYRHKEKKGAQLAHEAIRPTSINREPSFITDFVSTDETRLYELIWKRTLASYMHEALFENTKACVASNLAEFIAEGKKLIFDGFLKVFDKGEEEEILLPDLKKGETIELLNCEIAERTTKPPPRFNDASLVKLLEEKGIGRPSTYAPTVYTLIRRNYMRREKGYFSPTDLGIKVIQLLINNFSDIMNEDFTALMEERLDEVEEGKIEWNKILEEFYPTFKKQIDNATKNIKKEVEFVDKNCPKCNSPLAIKWSRKGRFLSCSSFPKCRYAESITTEINCPECKVGKLIERRNKRGQFFYGCSKFPACRYTSRTLPKEDNQDTAAPKINNTEGADTLEQIDE